MVDRAQPSLQTAAGLSKICLMLFAGAFAVRLLHLWDYSRLPIFDRPTVDAALYLQAARALAQDGSLPDVFFKPPLYPVLLGLWTLITPDHVFYARLLSALLGSFTVVVTFLLGNHLHGRRLGLLAASLYMLSNTAVHFEGEILEIALVTSLQCTALLCLVYFDKRPKASRRLALGTGLLLGMGVVARPTFLLFAIFCLVYLRHRRVFVALGLVLALLPVTLHNAVRGGDFVLVSSNGGMNFYIGNNESATGRMVRTVELPARPAEAERTATERAEAASGRPLKPSGVSRYWYGRGLAFIASEPETALGLLGKKLFFLWNGAAISDNEDLSSLGRYARFYAYLPGRMFYLAPLGLLGLLLWLRRSRSHTLVSLYVLCQVLALLPFFVVERFRLPWLPVLTLATSYVVFWFIRRWRAREWFRISKLAVAAMALSIACNVPLWGVRDPLLFDLDYKIAFAYQREGQIEKAIAAYREAVHRNENAALARNALGYLLAQQGRDLNEARKWILEAIQIDPQHAGNYYDSLAFVHLQAGEARQALAAVEQGLRSTDEPQTRRTLQQRRQQCLSALQEAESP